MTNSPSWKDLIFNINIPRFELKKNQNLTAFHRFIQYSVDAGLISRQEAVSMIPPILLNINPHDKVFDMCAAPGSKTAQFLEVLYKEYNFLNPDAIEKDTGFVLANDNNWNRAYMMIHQLKRLNTTGMVVISHDAQFFPTLYQHDKPDERIMFDKILADVPCSSDAVLRKLPHKWKNWGTKDSYSLHKLQLSILKRGVSLLKVGGNIIYSTCSLNPIENEAVVHEIMKTYSNSLEIVDMSDMFGTGSDIRSHPGLLKWKVMIEDKEDNKKLIEIKSKEDPLFQDYKDKIEDSCFGPANEDELTKAEKVYKIQNCIRLFPHDSDTSGFFITMFKKIAPIEYASDKNKSKTVNVDIQKQQEESKIKDGQGNIVNKQVSEKPKKQNPYVSPNKGVMFVSKMEDNIIDWLKNYYGLNSKFPFDQLITQSQIAKKINFVSRGVYELLLADKRGQLKLINLGVKLFSFNKKKLRIQMMNFANIEYVRTV